MCKNIRHDLAFQKMFDWSDPTVYIIFLDATAENTKVGRYR